MTKYSNPDSSWITQLRKGCAEYIVLLTLKDGEAYGYEILQALSPIEVVALGESTVYPLLSRLTREQYLSVRTQKSNSGPQRRYYRLTPAGRERLQQMEAYWDKLVKSIEHFKEARS